MANAADRRAEMRRELRTRKTDGVMLAGPNPGTVDGHFMASLSELMIHDANSNMAVTKWGGAIWLESSPRIFAARCDLVQLYLDKTADWPAPPEWLLFIDADMSFDADSVDRMLQTVKDNPDKNIKILGGLCFAGGRGKQAFPTLYTVENAKDWTPDSEMKLARHLDYDEGLYKVNATGGAFIMIHREVFLAMQEKHGTIKGVHNPYPWFREYEQAGQFYGEDIYFGLVAGSMGYPTWVDTRIKVGHMKKYCLNEAYFREREDRFRKALRAPGAPEIR